MIVVAIIALLAAIAIPNLLRARHNANETAAIAAARTISTAEESYRAAQSPPTYGSLALLIGAVPSYLNMTETSTGTVQRQGYNHVMGTNFATNSFAVLSSPVASGTTGTRIFCVDATAVVVSSASDGTSPPTIGGTAAADNLACTGGTPIQ